MELIRIGWYKWNGLIISVIDINDKSLFSINTDFKSFIVIDFLFFRALTIDKTEEMENLDDNGPIIIRISMPGIRYNMVIESIDDFEIIDKLFDKVKKKLQDDTSK